MAGPALAERLFEEQQEGTRAGDRFRLSVIRLLRADLKNGAIAKKVSLDAEEELAVLLRKEKRSREALAGFERAGCPEQAADLHRAVSILQEYLPLQLPGKALKQVGCVAIAGCEAGSKKVAGRVKIAKMPCSRGKADGKAVKAMIEEFLE